MPYNVSCVQCGLRFFFLLLQTYGHVMPWRRGIEELKEDRKARNREE